MSNIGGVIKSIRDIFRKDPGLSGDAQRIEQLGWMIFLKLFDDKDKEKEILDRKYKSSIPSTFQWRNWAEDDEGMTGDELIDFINNHLFPALKNLKVSTDNRLGVIIRNIFDGTNNYMKSGTTFRQAINKLNEIDFNSSKEHHIFNAIYEDILQGLATKKDTGEFYTPRAVTQFIIDMVNPKLGEKIIDPACGTAGFLVCAIEHLRKQVKNVADRKTLQETITGIELKPLPFMLSVVNLITHDIEVPQIENADALSRELTSIKQKDRVDIIVANPPFGGVVGDGMETNFPLNYRTKESADLFLILFIQLLKDGGRAGIVLPDGSLTGEGVKQRVRQKLLEDCNVHTIVRLPPSVFAPYATIATNLLFFEKGKPTKEIWYYEHTLPEGAKAYNKTKPIRLEEFEPIKAWWKKRTESEASWKVPIKNIIDRNYDLDIKNPTAKTHQVFEIDAALKIQKKSEDTLKVSLDDFKDGLRKIEYQNGLEQILEHIDKIIYVDKSTLQLDSIILNLAIRGKLIPQDINDEPAAALLQRIKGEKAKSIRKEIHLPTINPVEKPFKIPDNWVWCRLGEITNYGSSPKAEPADLKEDTWVLDLEDIEKTTSNLLCKIRFNERNSLSTKSVFKKGDVLYSKLRPYLDKVIVADEDGVCTTEILPLGCFAQMNPYFLRYALKRSDFLEYVNSKTKGMKMPRLGTKEGQMALIPLPPLSEQERIVAEIEKQFTKTKRLKELIIANQQATEQLLKAILHQAFEVKELEGV